MFGLSCVRFFLANASHRRCASRVAGLTLAAVTSAGWNHHAAPQDNRSHDWTRFGFDASRSNVSSAPTGITVANVGTLHRQQVALDGTIDASPIYLRAVQVNGVPHDVFFVTTTYGKTLAVDADDGAVLWRHAPAGFDTWVGSAQITTATPVADPSRDFIYAASPGGHIEKIAVADGHTIWLTSITKLARREKIASSLNFFHGKVIATTGGYVGDAPPYQGHVAILDAATGRLLQVWNSLCSNRAGLIEPSSCGESDSAIWGRAGAVIDTVTGGIFVSTGNGPWDGARSWGDAVIELDSTASQIIGNYTPSNTEELNASDGDLGSTSPVLMGELVMQGGKDGLIRVLEWKRMAGASPHRGGQRMLVGTPSGRGLFTAPAVWRNGGAQWMIAADFGGTSAFALTDGRLRQQWKNKNSGTSPVLAGGLLYVFDPDNGLRIYQPETGKELALLATRRGHWNSPIAVDGRIALPEGSANDHSIKGVLNIWRLARSERK